MKLDGGGGGRKKEWGSKEDNKRTRICHLDSTDKTNGQTLFCVLVLKKPKDGF